MKLYKNSLIALSLIFILTSCTLESKFSLPNDEKINPELIGEWASSNDDFTITIMKNNDKTYKVKVFDLDDSEDLIAFSKTINGQYIMNIVIPETENANMFYGVKIDGNKLIWSEVNEKEREQKFKSDSHLLKFFQRNVSKQDFFVNPIALEKKQ